MELLKYVSIKLSIGLILGILLGYLTNPSLIYTLLITSILLVLLGLLFFKEQHTKSIRFGILMLLTSIGIGVSSFSLSQPKNNASHYTHYDHHKKHTLQLKIIEVLKQTSFSNRYIVGIKSIDNLESTGKLILSIPIDSLQEKLTVDQEVITYSEISLIKPPLNPHQFDYKDYLGNLGIYHQAQLKSNAIITTKKPTSTIYGIAASIRNKINLKLQQANFGTDELAVIEALLLGQRTNISDSTYTNYKNAGAVHILALSGLHIGILLVLLQFILKPLEILKYGHTLKLIVIIITLWGFAVIAGLSASIIRAVTMFCFIAYAQFLNRPTSTFNILALSLFFTLLIHPLFLFQVGFQMSYAAVFAIIWIYPLLQRFWFPNSWIVRKGWQLLSVSIAAQLGVLPISLFYFHQFPGLFFVSNLIIIPFLGIVLGLGFLVIILSLIDWLPSFLASFYSTIIQTMNSIIKWIAQQEAFLFTNIPFNTAQLILSYVLCISLVLALSKQSFKKWAIFLLTIICFQCWTFYSFFTTQQSEKLVVGHETKNTLLLHQSGRNLNVLSSHTPFKRIVSDYVVGENIYEVKHQPTKNSYTIQGTSFYIMDSLGIYPPDKTQIILLTQSPRINLERFIDSIQPKIIIADGSNYKKTIKRWKASCKKRKLPFHYTDEKGAYYFNISKINL